MINSSISARIYCAEGESGGINELGGRNSAGAIKGGGSSIHVTRTFGASQHLEVEEALVCIRGSLNTKQGTVDFRANCWLTAEAEGHSLDGQ